MLAPQWMERLEQCKLAVADLPLSEDSTMPKVLRLALAAVSFVLLANFSLAEEKKAKPLTEKEIAEGWISLFDGETTFGWKVEGESKIENGEWIVGGEKETKITSIAPLPPGEVMSKYNGLGAIPKGSNGPRFGNDGDYDGFSVALKNGYSTVTVIDAGAKKLVIKIPAKEPVRFSQIAFRPSKLEPLFNGKDLSGWKLNKADPKRELSTFEVTKAGELRVANGPGDLFTEKQFADFVLQFECKTNGKALNSGIFFRCIPNEYQNGYEAQIQNLYLNDDRTKPADFGTGAIYRRVPARKVMANDNEWFTMTVIARGPHISTWVNGYQAVDWVDDRKADDNPRKGLRTAAGHLSIQGHDKTTDILFRNLRAVEMKTEGK